MQQSRIVVKGNTCRVSDCGQFYFDEQDALRFVNFVEKMCVHVRGPLRGQPLILLPWLRDDVIMPAFGWKRVEDDFRKHTEMLIFIGRKNSKTLGMAALALAMTAIDEEPGAEIYNIAATEEQARILFNMSVEMIDLSPKLKKLFDPEEDDVLKGSGIIMHRASGSYMRVLSGNSKAKTGGNPHGLFVDELHEFANIDAIEAISTGMVGRDQPMTAYTTTAGNNTNSPGYEEYDKAKKIKQGIVTMPHYLPVIYEPDLTKWGPNSWMDPEVHKQANPGYGMSVRKRYFDEKIAGAQLSVLKKAKFIQFNCNKWQGKGDVLIPAESWEACRSDYTSESLLGKRCFGGLDLADTRDLNAFALVFPEYDDDDHATYRTLTWFWVPEAAIETKKLRGYLYPQWVEQELIETMEGNVTDLDHIRTRVKNICGLFDVQEIGFDPYNSRSITPKMESEDRIKMTEVRQGWSLSPAIKELDILIGRKRFLHNGNPVLTFCVSNTIGLKDKKDNITLGKETEDNKIDGTVANVIALSRAMVAPRPKKHKMRLLG